MDIISINDNYRYIDAVNDLIPISKIKSSLYDFKVPTVIPETWGIYKEISQEEYDIEFKRKHNVAFEMLQSTENVIVAGGAAARPLYISNKNLYIDIDIFIYGITDEELFWKKINEIVEKITTLSINASKNCDITHVIKKGILIVGVFSNDKHCTLMEYQIILRMYHTLSSVIHAFDIPSCCVAYNGHIAYTTTLGAYSHANQVNLISTSYRSTSFERRLIKYYDRGFGLGLIGYNITKGLIISIPQSLLMLLHNYLNIIVKSAQDNCIIGKNISLKRHHKYTSNDMDYATIKTNIKSYSDLIIQIQCIEDNGITLLSNSRKVIDYKQFYNMEVSTVIDKFPNGIDILISKQCEQIQKTELRNLKYLNFPKIIIQEIIDIILNYDEYTSNKKIRSILMEQIMVHSRYIPEWIIVQDPQRQYTASLNPIIEDPEEWYGTGLYIN